MYRPSSVVLTTTAFVLVWLARAGGQKKIVHLTVFLPKTGVWPIGRSIQSAAKLAADDINADQGLIPDHHVNVSYHETGCNQGRALWKLIDEFTSDRQIDGIIGDGCDSICEMFGLFASQIDLPIISWGCQSVLLSDKEQFPTFARTIASYEKMLVATMSLLKHFRWLRFSIVATSDDSREWLAQAINEHAETSDMIVTQLHGSSTVMDIHSFPRGSLMTSAEEFEHRAEILEHLLHEVKIVMFCTDGGDLRKAMLSLYDMGMIIPGVAFVSLNQLSDVIYGINTWMKDDGRDEDARKAFQGMINIYIKKPANERYQQFERRVDQANAKPPFNYVKRKGETIDVHAAMLYDAVLLYSYALESALKLGYTLSNLSIVSRMLFNRSFSGIYGQVHIDTNGDMKTVYVMQVFSGDRFVDFAEISDDEEVLIYPDVPIIFPGGQTEIPRDSPVCGWENELCQRKSGLSQIALIAIVSTTVGLVLVCTLLAALMYRKLKFESEVNTERLWRIRANELTILQDGVSRSGISAMTINKHDSFSQRSDGALQVFHDRASYKGIIVCLTKIPEGDVCINRSFLISLKQARELHHENINPFIGLCIDPPHSSVVTSYATRGSLQDVLENDNMNISADFKLSFMMDICKGMDYLHSSAVGSHGRLKSSNCVVDNRWMCKVTDFGLEQLRCKQKWEDDYRRYSALLWTAPELLRDPKSPASGTRRGDVYSFGIILQEISTRTRPYAMSEEREPKGIIELVQVLQSPPFRPKTPRDTSPSYVCELMEQCWLEDCDQRPSFTAIRRKLKEANSGKDLNILDNMIHMMEQYANHLEEIVSDRTQQLVEEKKKTDQLLYQMLPRPVADSLKLGRMIEPEAYDRSTVYFSDIVGFTKMASLSSPLEVVNFLNDLYSAFDAIIDSHDVYKVETIGDAYMVVSGIPIQNGNAHAGAIASMSLDILSCIMTFKIRHMPDSRLHLRIGIHSGPAAAGVVGMKMPRYCLFGDTVNTASRMESNGLPLRIHISQATKSILDGLGGYITQERGEIQIKGKGKMTTYWLISQDNYTKLLPSFD